MMHLDAPTSEENLDEEQLKFCSNLLDELHSEKYASIACPFYKPVDSTSQGLHDYLTVVKQPMDLSMMRRKLDHHEYANALPFFTDFKLMIRNCFSYNQLTTPVNQAGVDLQRLFDEKWMNLPVIAVPRPTTDDGTDEGMETDEDERRVVEMEGQMRSMKAKLTILKRRIKERKRKEIERKSKKRTGAKKTSRSANKSNLGTSDPATAQTSKATAV